MERLLTVSVDLPGRLGDEVRAWAEVDAGWQVVDPAGPVRPVLQLAARPCLGPPCVVVVEGPVDVAAVRAGMQDGALDVVGWPDERDRLQAAPGLLAPAEPAGEAPAFVGVAGTGGGVGVSTVALAVGGLLAWTGRQVMVVGGDDLLRLAGLADWDGPGVGQLAALDSAEAAAEAADLARPVAGVPGLAALGGGWQPLDLAGWPADAVVADLRAPAALDGAGIVVARPDRSLQAAAAAPADARVLLCGTAAVGRAEAQRLLGRRPDGWLPHSARVAHAGVAGRVPAGLPGSWLAALRSALS